MAHPTQQGLKPQILIAALIAVLVFFQYLLWIAEDGVRQTLALRINIQAQIEENAALNERNRALEADVIDLKNGLMAIEERARAEMGMIRPDETFYRILEQPLPKLVEPQSTKPDASPGKPPVRSR
jgi:cell division protein FtsB